ncbi:hypothetical protein GGR56DRAFT_626713 [Xylariaceae sp. FL0804]|nr:hypothetical protein GGR56DRAFT_626713 [Xylariaceae sp. FL0804]
MSSSRSVCLLCRHRIATARGLRPPTTPSRFSTSTPGRTSDGIASATTPEPNVRRIVSQHDDTDRQHSRQHVRLERERPKSIREKSSVDVDNLFQQIIHGQAASSQGPALGGHNTDYTLVQVLGKLDDMVKRHVPIADAYAYFKAEIQPSLSQLDVHKMDFVRTVVVGLMDKVAATKRDDMLSDTLPSVPEILRVYTDIRQMQPHTWNQLVGALVESILHTDLTAEADVTAVIEQKHIMTALLADLIESWKILSQPEPSAVPTAKKSEITDGFWFPKSDKFALQKYRKMNKFPQAFANAFPQYRWSVVTTHSTAVLAVATFSLLLDPKRSVPSLWRSATRFVSKVAQLITFVGYPDKLLLNDVAQSFPTLQGYIRVQWPNVRAHLKARAEATAQAEATGHLAAYSTKRGIPRSGSLEQVSAPGAIDASFIGGRLTQALENRHRGRVVPRNIGEVDKLWRMFVGAGPEVTPERAAQLRDYPSLIDTFIHARMALNQPQEAMAAWDLQKKIGLRPTLRTWNMLLDGCKSSGNTQAIKNLWSKLIASGTRLDKGIWTTRVSGLIQTGDVQAGIKALEEMNQMWKSHNRDKNPAAIEPAIEPVNAALAGLMRQNRFEAAKQVLAWAGRQGIQADTYTFNTLLGPLIRDGSRDDEVYKLFETMKAMNVLPDAATFVLVLQGTVSKTDPGEPEEQFRVVNSVLEAMKASGLEPNLQTYGKIVHLLVQSDATQELKAVVTRIFAEGYELSQHIYTMLVDYYFSRSPPDVESVDVLLRQSVVDRQQFKYDDKDRLLYDRVIKGYVRAGHPLAALAEFHRVAAARALPSLHSLADLLDALVGSDEWERARGLVETARVILLENHPSREVQAVYWAHPFWQKALRFGLVDKDAHIAAAAAAAAATTTTATATAAPNADGSAAVEKKGRSHAETV